MSRKWNFETRALWNFYTSEEDQSHFVGMMCSERFGAIQICNTLFEFKEGHRVLQFLDLLGIYEECIEMLFEACENDIDAFVAVILAYDLESHGYKSGGVSKKSIYHSIKKCEAMFDLLKIKKAVKGHIPSFTARRVQSPT